MGGQRPTHPGGTRPSGHLTARRHTLRPRTPGAVPGFGAATRPAARSCPAWPGLGQCRSCQEGCSRTTPLRVWSSPRPASRDAASGGVAGLSIRAVCPGPLGAGRTCMSSPCHPAPPCALRTEAVPAASGPGLIRPLPGIARLTPTSGSVSRRKALPPPPPPPPGGGSSPRRPGRPRPPGHPRPTAPGPAPRAAPRHRPQPLTRTRRARAHPAPVRQPRPVHTHRPPRTHPLHRCPVAA